MSFPGARVSVFGSALMLAAWLSSTPAGAANVTVCPSGCDHVTIQAAAIAANPGDTIQILSVIPHTEGDIVLTKNLTIDGFGAGTTIIQAAATHGAATVPVFVVTNGASVTMLDLTLQYGGGNSGGGVRILDGHVTLEDVWVQSNTATLKGGGIYVGATSSFETNRTVIISNDAGTGGGGGVFAEGPVEMTDTDVTSNSADGSSFDGPGGGIWSMGTLTLRSCRLGNNHAQTSGNTASASGGGLFYRGPILLIEDSLISNNTLAGANRRGGGVFLDGVGDASLRRSTITANTAQRGAGVYSTIETLTVEDCTISNNVVTFRGGGMRLDQPDTGVARVLHSTIVGNEALEGGGMFSSTTGRVVISNSTISGNTATEGGGGIYTLFTGVEIASSTLTDNTADADADGFGNGGGILIASGETAELRNTIVASNHDSSPSPSPRVTDCAGTVQSAGYNLIRALGFPLTACNIVGNTTGNLVGVDPLLDALADNGGPTETHALGAGSAAIDAANPAGCRDPDGVLLDTDQRHGIRQNRCDMGAFEVGAYFEPFFADGFESGSTSEWSSSVP